MKYNFDILVRKLSRTNFYQTIYSQEKNLGIGLFRNRSDLTYIQIVFLNYLAFYSALYFDYSMGDVTDKVFEDFIYEDAYSYFKNKNRKKSKDTKDFKNTLNKDTKVTSQWVFKSSKSKKSKKVK